MATWRVIEVHHQRRSSDVSHWTIQRNTGTTRLDAASMAALKHPDAVTFVDDAKRPNILGMRASERGKPGAYAVVAKGNGGEIAGRNVVAQRVELSEPTRRRVAVLEGDVLVIDLADPGELAKPRGARR